MHNRRPDVHLHVQSTFGGERKNDVGFSFGPKLDPGDGRGGRHAGNRLELRGSRPPSR